MSEAKKERRQYSAEYIKYEFIENSTNPSLPLCFFCSKTFLNEAVKTSSLQDHLNKMYSDKNKNVAYFQNLEMQHNAQPSVSKLFSVAVNQDDDELRASYNIYLLIAQTGKPHTNGETLILPAIKEVITTVHHKPTADVKIPLSNNSVQRRIDEMAENIEESLCNHLKTSQFSIQLDESTLPTNEALLLSFVRFTKDEKICQELLFARNLETERRNHI
ncbi:unnamed protein product [Parnassius mnemosyne]|uniref:SCAN domain-containing protein 3 n=1 Tax=Parnassius mnemosyne TaxID=213953 RepID=A0AAV1LD30_9NEOP